MLNQPKDKVLSLIYGEIEDLFGSSSTKLKKHFHKMIEIDYNNRKIKSVIYLNDTKLAIDSYYKNKNLLKQYINIDKESDYHFDIMSNNDSNLEWHEYVLDNIIKLKEYSKLKKYANSFVRSYKDLLNDKSLELFRVIMKKEIDREEISLNLSKIAALDTDGLNSALQKVVEQGKITKKSILDKIDDLDLNATVINSTEKKVVVVIGDYEASKALGTSQWCISYNESNYESYLIPDDDMFEVQAAEYSEIMDSVNEIVLEGQHVFVWDLERDETDDMSQYAFTVCSAGTIVAAHDKNDEDILEKFSDRSIHSDACSEVASICHDVFMNKYTEDDQLSNWDHIYHQPFDIISNVSYPLSFYRKIAEKLYLSEVDMLDNGIMLPKELLTKTIEDHKFLGFMKDQDVIDDIIWLSGFAKEFKKYEPTENDPDDGSFYTEDEQDLYPYASSFNSGKSVLIKAGFFELLKKLPESSQYLILKKKDNNEIIKEILRDQIIEIDHSGVLKQLNTNDELYFNSRFRKMDNELLNFMSKNYELFEISNKERLYVTLSSLVSGEDINGSLNYIKESIKSGDLHVNHILNNIDSIKEDYIPELTVLLSEIDFTFNDLNLNALKIMKMSKSPAFIDNVSEKLATKIKKSMKNDSTRFGIFSSFESHGKVLFPKYDFADKMQVLYKKGVIDKESFSMFFDKSKLCFGDRAGYPKDDFKSIEDYIFSGKKSVTKKPQKNKQKI
jgi:hypothetical protein